MTNAEMYKKVFGLDPDLDACPTQSCSKCPLGYCTQLSDGTGIKITAIIKAWWESEYKGDA